MQRSTTSTIRGKWFTQAVTLAIVPAAFVGLVSLGAITLLATDAGKSTVVVLVALVVSIIAGAVLARRTVGELVAPIARLRAYAGESADATVLDVADAHSDVPVAERVPGAQINTGDEVEAIAESITALRRTAVEVAMGEAQTRDRMVAMFVNLGRREQNLLLRQMECINEMESNETDPEALQRLFQLDHLSTRMRRNAQSLLVLAGEEAPRRIRGSVPVHQLIQAASGEIEHFDRIEMADIATGSVEGAAASDIAHLLAELLENATSFTRPDEPIRVYGQADGDDFVLTIVDRGIGMSEDALAAANQKLADPGAFDRASSASCLGHYVVGRLAGRHGIHVTLTPATVHAGTVASVRIPSHLLTERPTERNTGGAAHADTVAPAAHFEPQTIDLIDDAASMAEAERQMEAIDRALQHDFAWDAPDAPAAPAPVADHQVPPAAPVVNGFDFADPAPVAPVAPVAPFADPAPVVNGFDFADPAPAAPVVNGFDFADPVAPVAPVAPLADPAPAAPPAPVVNGFDFADPVAPVAPAAPVAAQPAAPAMPELPVMDGVVFSDPVAPVAEQSAAPAAPNMPVMDGVVFSDPVAPVAEQPVAPAPVPQFSDPVVPVADPAPQAPAAPVVQFPQPATPATEPIEFSDPAPVSPLATGAADDTTPSGFRRRRRGMEGAPGVTAPAEPVRPVVNRRSPEEIQASLSRFHNGVESGRSHAVASNLDMFQGE